MGIDRARLPARHELKYYINPAELEALKRRLLATMRLDAHCRGGRPYNVRSLYFDDAFDSAYFDKVDGVAARDKYRLRIYNGDGEVIFLERKRKLGDLIEKHSLRVTRRLADRLISGDPRGLQRAEAPLLREMYAAMRLGALRPAALVEYDRLAFVHPAETTRVTFDMRLRAAVTGLDLFSPGVMLRPADEATEILEIKFDSCFPAHIRALLAGMTAQRCAISKYVMCRRFENL
ncbi:MAG TPA: polyphosphate polymerase domain-containing protein [Candidatus Pullichristensenella avicola]|nr:polyphosphate polymerase domain-containing protein [Candidatus Pullichristensenella avicola]